jgi:hypothetical protein
MTNMQKAGVRWTGRSDGDTRQPHTPTASLLYTVANKEVGQQFLGGAWHCSYWEQEEPAITTL